MYRLKDFPENEKPREKLIKNGPKALSNAELLAIIIRTGTKNNDVISLSLKIAKEYSIGKLSRTSINSLRSISGIGTAKACQIVSCFELGRRASKFSSTKIIIRNPKDAANLVSGEMEHLKKEHVIGIYLDARKNVIRKETLFVGSLDANIIHPREIFNIALLESAAGVILVHNHPSGNPHPSDEDIGITKQVYEAGLIIGIPLLDHLILGNNKFVSLKEKGYF
ncbi:MAG TPA: DNA repair protein RadC [Candidatus Nanoarchaeia archaeon]|nr:DNA repair protein RadC [Candidatus Nanoarchaeia archaeon]